MAIPNLDVWRSRAPATATNLLSTARMGTKVARLEKSMDKAIMTATYANMTEGVEEDECAVDSEVQYMNRMVKVPRFAVDRRTCEKMMGQLQTLLPRCEKGKQHELERTDVRVKRTKWEILKGKSTTYPVAYCRLCRESWKGLRVPFQDGEYALMCPTMMVVKDMGTCGGARGVDLFSK